MMARTQTNKVCGACGVAFLTRSSGKNLCSPECRVIIKAKGKAKEDCWEWDLSANPVTGYGQLSSWENGKRKLYTAHRVSFQAFVGEIPNGMSVLHHCDNRLCFNPAHLYAGTQKQNVKDMWDRGRAVVKQPNVHWTKTHPEKIKRGQDHFLIKNGTDCLRRGSNHPSAKVNENNVTDILLSKLTLKKLSEIYGISEAALSAIRRRKTWRHVK